MDWFAPPHVVPPPTPPQFALPIHGRNVGAVVQLQIPPALALISMPPHVPTFHVSEPDMTETGVPLRSAVAIKFWFTASAVAGVPGTKVLGIVRSAGLSGEAKTSEPKTKQCSALRRVTFRIASMSLS